MRKHFEDEIKTLVKRVESLTVKVFEQKITSPITPPATPSEPGSRPYAEMVSHSEKIGSPVEKLSETISNQERIIEINEREKREKNIIIMGLEDSEDSTEDIVMTLNAAFTRTPEHRNALLIFKRNHVAAASQQKQVLVRLTGILQAFLTYEKKVELLMELMS